MTSAADPPNRGATGAAAGRSVAPMSAGRAWYWSALVTISYLYYGFRAPRHLLLLAGLTLAVYGVGRRLGSTRGRTHPVATAAFGVALVLGALVAFRVAQAGAGAGANGAAAAIVPLGLSFYALRLVSYIVDVHRANLQPERNLGVFALYVAFFPEVTAGPIDRAGDLIPQLRAAPRFDYHRITDGLKLVAWGAFKKLVVAERLALLVDPVYRDPSRFDGISLATATVLYAFQIYCDFSAYSDIAIGLGEVLGFKLARNFDHPYVAKSISEFWRRWHMSLSSWLRDYVFLPAAYAVSRRVGDRAPLRVGAEYWGYVAAVAVTMTLAGAWHGLKPTFLVWGALMGAYMAISAATRKLRARTVRRVGLDRFPSLRAAFRVALAFFLVCMAWVVFRAESLGAAWYIWTHLGAGVGGYIARLAATGWPHRTGTGLVAPFLLGHARGEVAVAAGALGTVMLVEWMQRRWSVRATLARAPLIVRWAAYYGLILAIVMFGVLGSKTFIYARF